MYLQNKRLLLPLLTTLLLYVNSKAMDNSLEEIDATTYYSDSQDFDLSIKEEAQESIYFVNPEYSEHPFNQAYKCISRPDSYDSLANLIAQNSIIVHQQEIESEKTLLHHAVFWKKKDYIELLLKYKADINIQDEQGNSPFRNAFVNYLVEKNKVHYEIVDILAQKLLKQTVSAILMKKDDCKKRSSKYKMHEIIAKELLKFINSDEFISRFLNIKTTFLCFKEIQKKYRLLIPRPLQKYITHSGVGNKIGSKASEVYVMKSEKRYPKKKIWFSQFFSKKLTQEDFLSPKLNVAKLLPSLQKKHAEYH